VKIINLKYKISMTEIRSPTVFSDLNICPQDVRPQKVRVVVVVV